MLLLYFRRCILFFAVAVCLLSTAEGAIFMVKPGGTGDGSSWEKALGEKEFADALPEAAPGSEFWLVAGTYRPAVVSQDTGASRDRSFLVNSGVALYGGFAGDETARSQRRWVENETILSGRLSDDEESAGSYHVIIVSGDISGSAIIDGFTITGGQADGTDENSIGGGMYLFKSNPVIANCLFTENSAVNGGALYAGESSFSVKDSTFSGNTAALGGGIFADESMLSLLESVFIDNQAQAGGALYSRSAAPLNAVSKVEKCSFSRNKASEKGGALVNWESNIVITDSGFLSNEAHAEGEQTDGGALFNHRSTPRIENSTFYGNSAYNGGAIANWDSSPVIVNCTFSENEAGERGGALLNDKSSPILINSTFRSNSASEGGALFNYAGSPVIANSILWENGTEIRKEGGTTTITYSIVEGGFEGEGNRNQDPRLSDLADNGGFTKTCAIDENSPAVDEGLPVGTLVAGVPIPARDQRGAARPRRLGVDMGAFEYFGPNDPEPHSGGGGVGCQSAAGGATNLLILLPLLFSFVRRK